LSLIDQFFGIHHGSEAEDLMDQMMGRYALFEVKKDLGEKLLDKATSGGAAGEDEALDRALKKKALGLPWKDDLEEDDPLLGRGVLAAFGVKASKMMPHTPSFGSSGSGTLAKTPELAGELYHSILGGPHGGRGAESIVSKLLKRRG
jgi:hypothetical protein